MAPEHAAGGSEVKVVLLDIEGTICPIAFVKETLFPYALTALPSVLDAHWTDPAFFATYLAAFPEDARASPDVLLARVRDWSARDVKLPALKKLQGFLWEDGYRRGAYAAPLFADVRGRLEGWRGDGVRVAIYSSGSVEAQRLLFGHVEDGGGEGGSAVVGGDADPPRPAATVDLRGLVAAWFDTVNAGPKTEPASYRKIAGMLEHPTGEILFLSDNVKEVDAAIAAGMRSMVVDRPGNAVLKDADKERLSVVTSFDQIDLSTDETHQDGREADASR